MRSLRPAVSCLALVLLGCGAAPPASQDRKNWGEETPQGPRVRGTSMGMVTVQGESGAAYDVDGDGRADEIDIDGDGVSDGDDINGDGEITLWNRFRSGYVRDPNPNNDLPASDPDDFNRLDPAVSLRNEAPDGTITEPASTNIAASPMMVSANNSNGDILRPLNQGAQGSCTAFANAALVTLVRYQRERVSNPTVDANTLWASPSYIYARALGMSPCNEGSAVMEALNLFTRTGAATIAEQPYRSADNPMLCEPLTPDVATAPHVFRIGSWQRISGTGAALRGRIRESLAAGIPVPFGVELPEGFMEFRENVAGVDVRAPFRGTGMCMGSGHCGGHAMLITGYDDARGAYRVLNSWGADWGDGGYLWWDYASLEAGRSLDLYQAIPFATAPQPLPATPPAEITMTRPEGSQPVLRQVQYDFGSGPEMRWTLFVRVQFNDPVVVTTLTANVNGDESPAGFESTVQYGDLAFLMPAGGPPAAGTMAMLTVASKTRANVDVTNTLSVAIPAPSAN